MMDKKKIILLGIIAFVLVCTALFKYMTGSFLTISEDSKREVQRYAINLRRHDLSILSLTGSCKDIDNLYDLIESETDFSVSPCLEEIKTASGRSPKDSLVLMIFKEWMRHAVYSESREQHGMLINEIYSESNNECGVPLKIVFERDEADYWRITELRDLDKFMKCACPTLIFLEDH